MTTNLNAVAGPSKLPASPKQEDLSPTSDAGLKDGAPGVSKSGLSLDQNGEVQKVPAFLNKLFRYVSVTSNISCLAVSVLFPC